MTISNELFQIAGLFDRYRDTGGVISAGEAQFMVAKLSSLAEAANALAIAHRGVCSEFDRYIERNGGPVDRRPDRLFTLLGTDGLPARLVADRGVSVLDPQ